MATRTLWRPVGPEELALIEAAEWKAFPPRLPEQPIFYPVTNREYAIQIARDWNVPAIGSGFVTRFDVSEDFLGNYEEKQVGSGSHREFWIPAGELEAFNGNIVGLIEVTDRFFKDSDFDADELPAFVSSYKEPDRQQLQFDWNGKHADEFIDANLQFRRQVLDYVLGNINAVPLELIRDLLDAETQFAKEAWGVHMGVSALAEALLLRGRATYLTDYVDAMGRGMDAYCACRRISLPDDLNSELIQVCQSRVEDGDKRYSVLLEGLQAKQGAS